MPLEAGISKLQTAKIIILMVALLMVLLFNGKIKECISAWRMRFAGASGSTSASTQNDSPSAIDPQNLGRTIEGGLPLSEISRILASSDISEAIKASFSEKDMKTGQEWPDHLERDIFSFQTSGSAPSRPAGEITGGVGDKGTRGQGHVSPSPRLPRFKLEATLTGGAPVAVINNQPLMIGQSISGYQLLEIRDKRAVLTKDGQDIVLELAREEK